MTPTLEAQQAAGRRFFIETDGTEHCPLDFEGNPDIVLFFASWAYAVQFGGMHELAQAALHLQRKHRIKLRALLRYADRDIEDPDDARELERAWQPGAELAECCDALVTALESADERLRELTAGYEELLPRLRDLRAIAQWAADHDARVRMSFDMRHDEPTAPRPDLSAHGPLLGPLGRA
ncbi:MAG: hypothetical protein IT299_01630 [Dehalococcoidia bacterium]|nr:hypothetical protein [Dehalococcoidia bacterium]